MPRRGTSSAERHPAPGTRAAEELFERGFAADRVEVGVAPGERAKLVPHVASAPQVLDRVGRSAGTVLAAGDVVQQARVAGIRLEELASTPYSPS
jgi:hypothetical protein